MVDLESHRIVDMLPSRDVADVRNWLKEYPNIEVVSRDGAQIYASAITSIHPKASQVSDRFHVIKGLTESVDKYLIRMFPAKIAIPAVSEPDDEMRELLNINNRAKRIRYAHDKKKQGFTVQEIALILHSSYKTVEKYLNINPDDVKDRLIKQEIEHKLSVERKQKDVEEVRKMARKGIPIEEIAKTLHKNSKTIQQYLDPEYNPVDGHYNVRIPGKLAPYEKKVVELRSKGMTYSSIHKIITQEGYAGSVASLRMFIQKERIRNKEAENPDANSDYCPQEYIQRRSLSQIIYGRMSKSKLISEEQYSKVLETYPALAELFEILNRFNEIVFSKKQNDLDGWVNKVEKLDIPELNTYINGLKKDILAVKNGISLNYNNGLAEGSVNKIKVVKRIMYGRNSFELLKSKVLLYEANHC